MGDVDLKKWGYEWVDEKLKKAVEYVRWQERDYGNDLIVIAGNGDNRGAMLIDTSGWKLKDQEDPEGLIDAFIRIVKAGAKIRM